MKRIIFLSIVLISVCVGNQAYASAFQTAIITLVFPPGARATGLGEAFVGLADDANATFYNPAGLGLAPQSNSWKTYFAADNRPFTGISCKRNLDLTAPIAVWATHGTDLIRYNGKTWDNFHYHLIDPNENISSIVKKYLDTDDERILRNASLALRTYNGIEMTRFKSIRMLLAKALPDSLKTSADSIANAQALSMVDLTPLYRDSAGIIDGLLGFPADSLKKNELAASIAGIFASPDKQLSDFVDLKVPYSIAIQDTVTTLLVDNSDVLWVGTVNGLWRYNGESWRRFTIVDGLPSNRITTLCAGPNGEIGVGTPLSGAIFSNGSLNEFDVSSANWPDPEITGLAYNKKGTLYIGTSTGLLQKIDNNITVFDTGTGMLSRKVTTLMHDENDQIWIGGENGVSIYSGTSWKRYKFPGSTVYALAEYDKDRVWIGTDKGVITYKAPEVKFDDKGKQVVAVPEWKIYHSKNALTDNSIHAISVQNGDVWLASDKAINQFDRADKQLLFFWEQLLPTLGLKDLWHMYSTFVYPTDDWGTLGVSANFINFGVNEYTDEEGRLIIKFRSWELVAGVSYGLQLQEDLAVGLSIKYVHSALAPGIDDDGSGVAQSFAIDASILKRNIWRKGLSLGLTIQNMGPSVSYITTTSSDPIPFTLKLGSAYKVFETSVHDLTILCDLNREIATKDGQNGPDPFWVAFYSDIVKRDTAIAEEATALGKIRTEMKDINLNLGAEYWYVNMLALRTGFLFDYIGQRYELTIGLGVKYNNINIDFSYIHSPEGFFGPVLKAAGVDNIYNNGSWGVRDRQPRISVIMRF